jgi:hypothetical protein
MNGIYHRQTGSGPNCCIARRKQVTRGLNCWKRNAQNNDNVDVVVVFYIKSLKCKK